MRVFVKILGLRRSRVVVRNAGRPEWCSHYEYFSNRRVRPLPYVERSWYPNPVGK